MSSLSWPARLGLGLLLAGGLAIAALGAMDLSDRMQQRDMIVSAKENAAQPNIPALDLTAPDRVETATFALG